MTQRNYEDPNYKKWRKEVYRRDGFKCRWPNCKARRGLNAHHIKTWAHYPGLRFEPNNGITLCRRHHKQIQGMEDAYEAVFLKILAHDRLQ